MTPEEIRDWKGSCHGGYSVDLDNLELVMAVSDCFMMLREIAAQIAEVNRKLDK